jgi:hypothetical protein
MISGDLGHSDPKSEQSFYLSAIGKAEKLAIHSPQEARQSIAIEGLRPFETRVVEGVRIVVVPENLNELVDKNYLFVLAALGLKTTKCKIVQGKTYEGNFVHSTDQQLALNGFGIPLVEGFIPKFRKDLKGPLKKGLHCAIQYICASEKFLDRRWLIFGDSSGILPLLFGSTWATKHQDEKVILDFIINCFSSVKITHIDSYLLNVEELKKRLGLKSNRHKNQIISADEQRFIEEDYKVVLDLIRDFKYEEYDGFNAIIVHMKATNALSKNAKPYSDMCKQIINERLSLIYKGEGKKKKNVPIAKLVDLKSNTPDYARVFNPCMAAGCKTPFRVGSFPENDEERRKIRVSLGEWAKSQKGNRLVSARLSMIESWYYDVLGL